MVCAACEAKLGRVACPDVRRGPAGGRPPPAGAQAGRGAGEGAGSRGRGGLGENKLLAGKRKWQPDGSAGGCKVCGQSLHQEGIYCQPCAYSLGVCSMCGVKMLDTSGYRMSEGSRLAEEAQQKGRVGGERPEEAWKLVKEKGYYVHLRSRFFWDPKSRFYYHKKLGWTKQLPTRAKGKGQGRAPPAP